MVKYKGKYKNLLDSYVNSYFRVFEVADYELISSIQQFKMAGPIWWKKMQNLTRLRSGSVLGGIVYSGMQSQGQNEDIRNNTSNMVT